jgi:hypothetical protein
MYAYYNHIPTWHCIANVEPFPSGVENDPMVALELSGAH